jgi:hypothetical protein
LGYFRGFQYSHSVANVIDDLTLQPVNDTWHPKIENVVYWGMDWLCPGYTSVLSAQLQKYHGIITPEITIQYITAITQTGDLRISSLSLSPLPLLPLPISQNKFDSNVDVVISDLTNLKMYVAFAAAANESGPVSFYSPFSLFFFSLSFSFSFSFSFFLLFIYLFF